MKTPQSLETSVTRGKNSQRVSIVGFNFLEQGGREVGASLGGYGSRGQTGVSGSLGRDFSIGGLGGRDSNHYSNLMGSLDPLI
jgi:hypothetical protein